jgi:nicotinamidase-related amidase
VSSDRRAQEERKDSFTTARRNARAMTSHPALEKMTLDAFRSTPLNYRQRANEIETVAFTGFHTNWCVESSARSAYDLG